MEVETVAVLQRVVHAAVAEAGDRGQFVPRLRIEIGVAEAASTAGIAEAQVGQPRGVVGAARDVSEHVPHVIVDALIPFQGAEVVHVGKVALSSLTLPEIWLPRGPVSVAAMPAPTLPGRRHTDRQLAAKYRRGKSVGGQETHGVGARMQAGDDGRIELQILAPAGVGFDVKIDAGETPAGCPGTAERLPMPPGNQKPTPPASAFASSVELAEMQTVRTMAARSRCL